MTFDLRHPQSRFERFVAFVVLRQRLIFPFALLSAIIAAYYATQLKLESNLAALLPDDYPIVQAAAQVKQKIGGFETLQILIEGQDFEAMKTYAAAIAQKLEADDMVLVVDWQKDAEFFQKNALLYVSLADLKEIRKRIYQRIEHERNKHSPFASYHTREKNASVATSSPTLDLEEFERKYVPQDKQRYYINAEKTLLVLNVYPDDSNQNVAFARKFYKRVQGIVNSIDAKAIHPSLQAYYGGNFKNKIDEYEVIIDDVTSTLGMSLLAVAFVVMLTLRQPVSVLVVAVPLTIGIAWNFGLVYAVIGRLNTLTVFLFMILFGLGIDFGIHFFSRYVEERRSGLGVNEALAQTLLYKTRAFIDAAATTMAAFYSLMLADFRGFYEFGFIAGNGIALTLLSTILTAPGVFQVVEKLGWVHIAPPKINQARLSSQHCPTWLPRTIILAALASMAVAITTLPYIGFEYDFSELRAELPESRAVKKKLRSIFDESNSPALVLTNNKQELDDLAAWVKQRQETDPTPTIDKFRSAYSALPKDQDKKLHEIWRIRELLSDERVANLPDPERSRLQRLLPLLDVKALTVEDLPENIKRIFRARDGRLDAFGLILPSVALKDGRNAIAFNEDVAVIKTESGNIFYGVNSSVIFADMLTMMLREGMFAVVATVIAIFGLILIDFRSLKTTILVMTPFSVGMLWLALDMYFEGIQLNFFNIVALPTIIGIGIDFGVHIYHRYHEYGPGSVRRAMLSSLEGVLGASLTGIVGFGGLMFAHHGGLKAIGDLAVRGITFTLLATLVVMPAMLALVEQLSNSNLQRPLVPRPGLKQNK